jgi:hypothetical protein
MPEEHEERGEQQDRKAVFLHVGSSCEVVWSMTFVSISQRVTVCYPSQETQWLSMRSCGSTGILAHTVAPHPWARIRYESPLIALTNVLFGFSHN